LSVAGSNTFDNYRHQADVAHAYQIVKKNGIPPENIIMLSFLQASKIEQRRTRVPVVRDSLAVVCDAGTLVSLYGSYNDVASVH
jgi:glycosylphosphatidylinositol transamidase (GPIT) subunit GPI8